MDLNALIDAQKKMADNEAERAQKNLDFHLDQCDRVIASHAAQAVIQGAKTIMANPTEPAA